MKEESKALIKKAINDWQNQKSYTYQSKEVAVAKSSIVKGELIFKFTNSLKGFFCKGIEIPINVTSKAYHTTTLSDEPLSKNSSADQYRIQNILRDLDEQFFALVSDKFTECDEVVFTTDPSFW